MSSADDFKQAASFAKISTNSITAFSKLFGRSLGVAEEMAERMVHNWIKRGDEVRLNKAITNILGAVKSKDDMLVFTPVDKEAAETFSALYQRDLKRPAMIADFLETDRVADGIGDLSGSVFEGIKGKEDLFNLNNPSFVSLKSEQEIIEVIRSETYARLGITPEIDRRFTDIYKDNLWDNPMQEIKGLSLSEYEALKKDIQMLPKDMRFTLFPEYKEKNGKVTVNAGFLTKTGGIGAKNAYDIAGIVKNILTKEKALENSEYGDIISDKLEKEALNRKTVVQEYIKDKPIDNRAVIREIHSLEDAPEELKTELEEFVRENFYSMDNSEIKAGIEKIMKGSEDINYNELLHVLDEEPEKTYVMKADVFFDEKSGKVTYKFDRENYAVIGKTLVIRESGEKDLVIGNGVEDKKSANFRTEHEAQELGAAMQRWQKSDESTIVALTSKEFKSIINGHNKKQAEELSYFDNHDESIALPKEAVSMIDDAATITKLANVELRDELKAGDMIDRSLVFEDEGLYQKVENKKLKDLFVEQSEYADSIRITPVTKDRDLKREEKGREKSKERSVPFGFSDHDDKEQ